MHRQGPAVTCPQVLQPLTPTLAQRLVAEDALGEEYPLIRLTCLTRSPISVRRSRQTRRRSSSCGVGALAIEHTRGSPRLKAIRVRTRVSPSIRSVFARRRRREVRIEAGSTTWLSIPSDCSTRWIQKPSKPASWMTMIGKSRLVRAAALRLSSANRCSSPDTSLAGTECLDIFSPAPGDREVISQVLRDSSIETKIAPRSVRIAACGGWGAPLSIFGSRVGISATSLSRSAGRSPNAHRIFLRKAGVVEDPRLDRAAAFDDRQGQLLDPAENLLVRPRCVGNEMQQ